MVINLIAKLRAGAIHGIAGTVGRYHCASLLFRRGHQLGALTWQVVRVFISLSPPLSSSTSFTPHTTNHVFRPLPPPSPVA